MTATEPTPEPQTHINNLNQYRWHTNIYEPQYPHRPRPGGHSGAREQKTNAY